MYREHPITILKYSTKSLWLLIFPLLRGLRSIHLNVSAFYHWIQGVWFDLLVLGFILLAGYLRWRFTGFSLENRELICTSGVFIRRRTVIPFRHLAVMAVEQPAYLRPLLAFRIQFNTRAGSVKSPDLKLLVRRKDYRIIKQYLRVPRLSPDALHRYLPKWWNIVLFSILFSSSLSGVIYAATFFFQSGRTLDQMLETSLTAQLGNVTAEVAQEVSGTLSPYIHYIDTVPPIIISIGILLIAAWLLSFLSNILRYIGFRYEQNDSYLHIRTGLFTRRRYLIRRRLIHYVDLRQNLLMKLCRVMSVTLSCAGYGYAKSELPVLIPFVNEKQLSNYVRSILPLRIPQKNQFAPPLKAILQYLWRGLLLAALEPFLIWFLIERMPSISGFLHFFLLMLEIPTVWYLLVRFTALRTTGVTLTENQLRLRYCRGFGFHTVLTDLSGIAKTQVRISPLQRINKRCDLTIYLKDERAHPHLIAGLYQADAQRLLACLEKNSSEIL